jgi:dolichol-phosphate mannosyltransferase
VLSGGVGLRRTWIATVAMALLLYGAALHYLALGLPGVGYRDSLRGLPVAWRAFGAEVTVIEEDVRLATGQEPLLVGMDKYFLASEIAFYGGNGDGAVDSAAGRGVLGGNSLMYDYWFPGDQQAGRTLILFSLKPEDLKTRFLAAHFAKLGALEERVVYKQGAPVGRFYYRIGYDFRP